MGFVSILSKGKQVSADCIFLSLRATDLSTQVVYIFPENNSRITANHTGHVDSTNEDDDWLGEVRL